MEENKDIKDITNKTENLPKQREQDGLEKLLQGRDIFAKLMEIYKSPSGIIPEEVLLSQGLKLGKVDKMLRNRFWDEVKNCYINGFLKMDVFFVYGSVCSLGEFTAKLEDEKWCHYLLNPVGSYSDSVKLMLQEKSQKIYEEILCVDSSMCEDLNEWHKLMKLKMDTLGRLEKICGYNGSNKIAIGISSRHTIEDLTPPKKGIDMGELRKKIVELESELGMTPSTSHLQPSNIVDAEFSSIENELYRNKK